MRRSLLVWAFAVGLVGSGALVTSCGARSQLLVGDPDGVGGAGEGGGGGHRHHHDAGHDAPDEPDVDAPPPFDCVEAGITYVYLMTADNKLLAFYPPDLSVATLGTIDCPAKNGSTPFSMAVDRSGIAYVVFTPSGELFRVSPADVSCQATDFVPNQHGFRQFGMGFSSDSNGPGETLYVAEISAGQDQPSKGLGKIDTDTFQLDFVGPFSENFGDAMELTGTGDAKLYGYMLDNPGPGGHVLEIDKTSGEILSTHPLEVGNPGSALAFAFWGGSFYIFTSQDTNTHVHRWDPEAHTIGQATVIEGEVVVGAGVSTCAPAH